MLQVLPTWELWSMDRAPREIRQAYDDLVYLPQYEKECIICSEDKEVVSSLVRDTPQAYEQMEPRDAKEDLG